MGIAGSPAADHLRTIVGHHVWATLRLLDHCQTLPPAQLELTAPGTYGAILQTLSHLVSADGRYLHRMLTGQPRPRGPAPASLAAIREEAERHVDRWREALERLDELDCLLPAEPDEDPPYPEIEHAIGLLIVQAIHHGNEHRAHVCTVLGASGLESPELSGWEYVRQQVLAGEAPA